MRTAVVVGFALLAGASFRLLPAQAPGTRPFEGSMRAAAAIDRIAAQTRTPPCHSPAVMPKTGARRSPGMPLLIAGGAVALAGLLVDEDLLVIGGVVVAGYGLYLHMR